MHPIVGMAVLFGQSGTLEYQQVEHFNKTLIGIPHCFEEACKQHMAHMGNRMPCHV